MSLVFAIDVMRSVLIIVKLENESLRLARKKLFDKHECDERRYVSEVIVKFLSLISPP